MGVAKRVRSMNESAERPSEPSGAERTLEDSFEDLTTAVLNLKRDRDKLASALRRLVRECTPDPIPLDGGKIYGVRCPDKATVDAARDVLASAQAPNDATAPILTHSPKHHHDKLVSALRAIISRTNCTSHEMGTDIAAIASDALAALVTVVEGK